MTEIEVMFAKQKKKEEDNFSLILIFFIFFCLFADEWKCRPAERDHIS